MMSPSATGSGVASHSAPATRGAFPPTRYQGSKRKLAAAIVDHLLRHDFTTVLDAFGGTGAIAHALKRAGKRVTYNDVMQFNHQIGLALIENDVVRFGEDDLAFVQTRHPAIPYDDFIERTFDGVYFTGEENRWLDTACQNIARIACPYRRAIAWFAVFQAAMIKRPYNLFHRSNLSMRLGEVRRTFGNKTTWEGSFDSYFRRFAAQANDAVFDSGGGCRSLCANALELDGSFDLVYIDTPYIKRNGVGTDYHAFYHFLDGMVRYADWGGLIDRRYKHLPLRTHKPQPWSRADQVLPAFQQLLHHFRNSIICISYRSDGIPSVDELRSLLSTQKRDVQMVKLCRYQYALSPSRNASEMLLIGS